MAQVIGLFVIVCIIVLFVWMLVVAVVKGYRARRAEHNAAVQRQKTSPIASNAFVFVKFSETDYRAYNNNLSYKVLGPKWNLPVVYSDNLENCKERVKDKAIKTKRWNANKAQSRKERMQHDLKGYVVVEKDELRGNELHKVKKRRLHNEHTRY